MSLCRIHTIGLFIVSLALNAGVVRAEADATQPTTSPATAPTTVPTTVPTSAPTTSPTTAPTTAPASAASLADFASKADEATATIESVDRQMQARSRIDAIDEDLVEFVDEVSTQASETSRLLTPAVSIDLLRTLDRDWTAKRAQVRVWQGDLNDRGAELSNIQRQLETLKQDWVRTIGNLQQTKLDPSVLDHLRRILRNIVATQDKVTQQQGRIQALINRVNVQDVKVSEALSNVHAAQSRAFSRLTTRDSPELWNAFSESSRDSIAQQSVESLGGQWRELMTYLRRAVVSVLVHLLIIFGLAGTLWWMSPRVRAQLATDARAQRAAVIFRLPFLTAFMLSILSAIWIYPQAPRLFWGILGSLVLVPLGVVVRSMIKKPLRPLLFGTIGVAFLGLVQTVLASQLLLSRLVYLLETGGAAAFIIAFLWYHSREQTAAVDGDPDQPLSDRTATEPPPNEVVGRAMTFGLQVATLLSLVSTFSNALGFVALAKLLAGALVTAAYLGLVLQATVIAADALFLGAMNVRPLNLLRMVRESGSIIRTWVNRAIILLAACFWTLQTLDSLAIRRPVLDFVDTLLWTEYRRGALQLSIGNVATLALTVAASFILSRVVRFLLEEDVYPRVHLGRGIPYAISTMLHYSILLLGFLAAISTVYDLSQFTILASAFGIGLGFGLQNIVNNFVSGLILLFERPVQVGDVIEVGGTIATVTRIGIRASVVSTPDSADIIIPNGQLISDRVTNWTLTGRDRGLTITINTARSHDPEHVLTLLISESKEIPEVAEYPAPRAVVSAISATSLSYELRVWTSTFEDWAITRSKLIRAINAVMEKEKIDLL